MSGNLVLLDPPHPTAVAVLRACRVMKRRCWLSRRHDLRHARLASSTASRLYTVPEHRLSAALARWWLKQALRSCNDQGHRKCTAQHGIRHAGRAPAHKHDAWQRANQQKPKLLHSGLSSRCCNRRSNRCFNEPRQGWIVVVASPDEKELGEGSTSFEKRTKDEALLTKYPGRHGHARPRAEGASLTTKLGLACKAAAAERKD